MACLMESKGAIAEYLKNVDAVVDPSLSDVADKYEVLYKILQKSMRNFL